MKKTIINYNQVEADRAIRLVKYTANKMNLIKRELDDMSDKFSQYTLEELDQYIKDTTGFPNAEKAAELLNIDYRKFKNMFAEVAVNRHQLVKKKDEYVLPEKKEKQIRESYYKYLSEYKEEARTHLDKIAELMDKINPRFLKSIKVADGKHYVDINTLAIIPASNRF